MFYIGMPREPGGRADLGPPVPQSGELNVDDANDGSYIHSFGNADTIEKGGATGIFFIINPSEGEETGDPVILSWDWSAEAKTGHHSTADMTGGHGGDMAITIASGSDPAVTIWSYSQQSLSSEEEFTDGDSGQILVHIGDIIGVYLGAYVHIYDWAVEGGSYSYHASSEQVIDLYVQPVPLPGAVWLLGSGLLGLAALRRRRKS